MEKHNPQHLYTQMIAEHGPTPPGVGWRSIEEQWRRFDVMFKHLDVTGMKSLLDVGCGYGELLEFLMARRPNLSNRLSYYAGIDTNPTAIDYARARYTSGTQTHGFLEGDVRQLKGNTRFDLVVGSGVLSYYDMMEKLEILHAMWDRTINTLAFNLRTKEAYMADLTLIMGSFKSKRWSIDHDYGLDEVTVVVRK
jgi:2-polyprenyl-3-methyl-5-hydroxy-6-metoxy-1,4-benzoquinol methylase